MNLSLMLLAAMAVSPHAPATTPISPKIQPALFQQSEDRLGAIALELRNEKSDAKALFTEAARLCGFAIWKEDRTKVADPVTTPGLGLALTDSEIAAYAKMYRRGDHVALTDLLSALEPTYKDLGGTRGLAIHVQSFLTEGPFNARKPVSNLATFLNQLAANHDDDADNPITAKSNLDALQALMLMRVLTEELALPLRKSIAKQKSQLLLANAIPQPQQTEAPGWAEDAFAGGITGLIGELGNAVGGGAKSITDGIGKANALASISKFIMTYSFLKGEAKVETPGDPLIRTKDTSAGDTRTVVAKFYIDGTQATDWIKDNRKLFNAIGLDPDVPKSGPLKGVETAWEVGQSRLNSKQLIQYKGQIDISKIKTNDQGEARVTFEGKPQPKKLDPRSVVAVTKTVWITVTPQVKSTEMQQDFVDAVTGAIGLKEGAAGLLTPAMEMLYRMKWNTPVILPFHVRDWVEGKNVGQLTLEIRGNGREISNEHSEIFSVSHTVNCTDIVMEASGGTAIPDLDPNILNALPPEQRKQMEEGLKKAREFSNLRMFTSKSGDCQVTFNDQQTVKNVFRACTEEKTSSFKTWKGQRQGDANLDNGLGFMVSVDMAKKQALVTIAGVTEGVFHFESDPKNSSNGDQKGGLRYTDNLKIDDPAFTNNGFTVPLKETQIRESNDSNFYGTLSIPVKFGSKLQFTGNLLLSFSITRKGAAN